MTGTGAIRPPLADVDGTLVTPDKELTDRAVAAVRRLGDAGILFAITSGQPRGAARGPAGYGLQRGRGLRQRGREVHPPH